MFLWQYVIVLSTQAITREYGRQKTFLMEQVSDAKRQLAADTTEAAASLRKATEVC